MISRNFTNKTFSTTPSVMANNYDNMLNSVVSMLQKQGPIYTTWIRFQIGKTEPIVFDSTSTNIKENMITNLTFNKKGCGTVNDFTLEIKYDPFNYGQETQDRVEVLDELIAEAMSFDMLDDTARLFGYIQYGYNIPDDTNLVSPKYEFILTNAECSIDWSNGISSYTFQGTTSLAADSNFTVAIPEYKQKNLISIIESVLWSWYGDKNNPPAHVISGTEYHENIYNYKIQIDETLYTNAPIITKSACSKISPWLYCKDLLQNNISASDAQREIYQNIDALSEAQRPRYILFVGDEADNKTIYINYVAPADSGAEDNISLNYKFTWSYNNPSNIVLKWNPQTYLTYYLLKNALKKRQDNLLGTDTSKLTDEERAGLTNLYKSEDLVYEMYDAELTILGVPGDLPVGCELTILPVIMESVSRTAGIYMVQSITDNIDSSGAFTSTLKLLRCRGIDEPPLSQTLVQTSNSTGKDTSDTPIVRSLEPEELLAQDGGLYSLKISEAWEFQKNLNAKEESQTTKANMEELLSLWNHTYASNHTSSKNINSNGSGAF